MVGAIVFHISCSYHAVRNRGALTAAHVTASVVAAAWVVSIDHASSWLLAFVHRLLLLYWMLLLSQSAISDVPHVRLSP